MATRDLLAFDLLKKSPDVKYQDGKHTSGEGQHFWELIYILTGSKSHRGANFI